MKGTRTMSKLYKYSRFNIIVKEEDNRVLLYNTYSLRYRWMDKSDFDDIRDKSNIDLGDVPVYIAEEGFIVKSNINELYSDRHAKINHIDFEVTPFCNENCIHCFNHWRTSADKSNDIKVNNTLTAEDYLRITEKMVDLQPNDVLVTGGEPLSVFNKISRSLDLMIEHGIKLTLNTNGIFLNDEIADYISKNNIALFISLPCSDIGICDKITGTSGSLEKISKSILLANQHNINLAINMVVTKMNVDYIYSTAEYVKNELKRKSFAVTKAMLPCNSNHIIKDIILNYNDFQFMLNELLKIRDNLKMEVDSAWEYSLCGLSNPEQIKQFAFRRRCRAGAEHICVNWNGDIKPCSISSNVYGNIIKDEILDVIDRMACWRDNSLLPKECISCKHLKYCGGGCRVDAENTYGKKNHIDSTANINNKDIDYEEYFKAFIQNNIKARH